MTTPQSIFGAHGRLSTLLDNFEFRSGQLDMAEAVEHAIQHQHHLVVEAGTGTGKTLAYLVPAVKSGKRVVISTGTKNLQEQLFFKDIPLVEELFPGECHACLMKGRSNYLCLKKLSEAKKQPMLESMEEVDLFQQIDEWAQATESGDRAEIPDLPEDLPLWSRLDARAEDCLGKKCSDYERCFIVRMRARAEQSNIIIANHHLVFADLAVRESDFGSVLPEYEVLILDEAHTIENIATQYFGIQISNYRLEELVRDTYAALRAHEISSGSIDAVLNDLSARSLAFFGLLAGKEGRFNLIPRLEQTEHLGSHADRLASGLEKLEGQLGELPNRPEIIFALIRRSKEMRQELDFLLRHDSRNHVYWLECRGGTRRAHASHKPSRGGVFLQASPIHLGGLLRERLFDHVPTVVLTSATLSVSGKFEFIRSRLGLEESPVERVREALCPSHFDHRRQAILFVPTHLPPPGSADYTTASVSLVAQLLELTQGRAFFLFTSIEQMQRSFRVLKKSIPYPVLMQGQLSRTALLNKFRKTPHAVLCATASFWHGVDVVGEQLSCVIIDKLPFAVPDDPIVRARTEALEAAGRNGFLEYQVPEAVIQLKQGLGRLIRSTRDYGLLAVLDDRVIRKSYGQMFLASLPDYRLTHSLDEIRQFLESFAAARQSRRK
ncbi:MAG: ATP-dependent DNA helicase [Acidobacteriia bacterium]|nr:ATP-dependent DNA helicase [Terriglobia bacterium]